LELKAESAYTEQLMSPLQEYTELTLSRILRLLPLFPGKMMIAKVVQAMAPAEAYDQVRLSQSTRFRMLLHPANSVDFWLRYNGIWEPELTTLVMRILRGGATVVDVGANIGYYTCLFSKIVGPSGSVHSFEPIPWSFEELSRNVVLNQMSNVVLNNLALLSKAGGVTMHRYPGPDPGQDSIGGFPGPNVKQLQVSAVSLDDYVAGHNLKDLDFVKLDVEGAEPAVIEGGRETLQSQNAPDLITEANPLRLHSLGFTTDYLYSLLESLGYSLFVVGRSGLAPIHRISPISRAHSLFATKHAYSKEMTN
jgi:FkbM family methyltransferase